MSHVRCVFCSKLDIIKFIQQGGSYLGICAGAYYGSSFVEFDKNGRVIGLEEKPESPKSKYAVPGIYFFDQRAPKLARYLKPSPRGEIEITDLNRMYLDEGTLKVEILDRGYAWLDTGTHENLMSAGQFVQVLEKRQGFKIACLEELGYRNGWITKEKLMKNVVSL